MRNENELEEIAVRLRRLLWCLNDECEDVDIDLVFAEVKDIYTELEEFITTDDDEDDEEFDEFDDADDDGYDEGDL